MVRNVARDKRSLRFCGEARIVDDADLRERIWERVIQVEKDTDPEKTGAAVLVRVDRAFAVSEQQSRAGGTQDPLTSPATASGGRPGTLI